MLSDKQDFELDLILEKCRSFEVSSFATCWGDRGLSTLKSLLEPGTKEGFGADEDDMTVDASSIPILNIEKA